MRFYSFLLLVVSFSIQANTVEFDNKYWLKLLHFEQGVSKADGEKFFLAPNGKKNSEEELKATISAFFDPNMKVGWFNYHPQCVFRARYEFLKEMGLLKEAPIIECPEFNEWKSGLNAESITLIFSSSYPNNPSSLFGHTLLRLNQKDKKNDLLDYAVAFSAIPEKEDPGLIFAFKGFSGGYKGLFEVTKYYTKVNEYNNGESRDLIEYNLAMTPEELDRTINHLWEIYQTTYFDYYFADENCSAVLADLIAVGYKDDDRVNAHARWYYLPGEMVKHFSKLDGRIKSTNYRPSLKKQVAKMWDNLTPEEIHNVKNILDQEVLPDSITNIKVLDAVIAYLDFTHYRTKQKLNDRHQKMLRVALVKRAKLPKAEIVKESFDQNNMPEYSHNPQKFSFFARVENHNTIAGFEIKQGYHDLMSNDRGFDTFSQFDILTASFIYDFKIKKLDFDKITVVDLISLHEYSFYDPQMSWRAKVASERIFDLDCTLCHKVNANAYGGLSFRSASSVFSIMFGVFGEVSSNLNKGFRVGPGSEISFFAQVAEFYKLGLVNELRFGASKKITEDFYNQISLRHSFFKDNIRDYRLESSVISKFGSFTKNTTIHQVTYGQFF